MTGLLLSPTVLADLARWAQAGYSLETCGLLVGFTQGDLTHVRSAVQVRNLAPRAIDHYDLDPGAHVVAEREARAQGLAIVGIWHSHPDQPAVPSASDRATAWEGWSYLILSVGTGGLEGTRSWRLRAGVFEEETIAGESASVEYR